MSFQFQFYSKLLPDFLEPCLSNLSFLHSLFHLTRACTLIYEYVIFFNALFLPPRKEQCLAHRRCLINICSMNMCCLCKVPYNLIYSILLNFLLCLRVFQSTDLREKYQDWINAILWEEVEHIRMKSSLLSSAVFFVTTSLFLHFYLYTHLLPDVIFF